jgi:hypothetical protein
MIDEILDFLYKIFEVDGFVKTISPSFLDALPREEWLPEG